MRLHHVQVSCPPGGEDGARRFYTDGLGMVQVPKPPALAGRGGAWFRAYDDAGGLAARLERLGLTVDHTERDTFEGFTRFHVSDSAGNRVEVLSPR